MFRNGESWYNKIIKTDRILSSLVLNQGSTFSDFNPISGSFIFTPTKTIFEISSLKHVSHVFVMDSDFQK